MRNVLQGKGANEYDMKKCNVKGAQYEGTMRRVKQETGQEERSKLKKV